MIFAGAAGVGRFLGRKAACGSSTAGAIAAGVGRGAGVTAAETGAGARTVASMAKSVVQRARPKTGRSASLSSLSSSQPDSPDKKGGSRTAGPGDGAMCKQLLPRRTVSGDILGFSCRTYMAGDSEDRYPNIHGVHPAEFKVELTVPVPLLGLSAKEEERLIQLVGPRYREKNEELRLVSDRFPNRIDNKRYLVFLLENILVEARDVQDDE